MGTTRRLTHRLPMQAAGKGIGRPAFRVIQNHFATRGNVGDVAAREEIWEVTAQLVGLAASVAVLQALESATSSGANAATSVIATWAAVQAAHLALRCGPLPPAPHFAHKQPADRTSATLSLYGCVCGGPGVSPADSNHMDGGIGHCIWRVALEVPFQPRAHGLTLV